MIKDMLLIGESYGFEGRNLCFRDAKDMLLFQFSEPGAFAGGLYVVEPLAVVAYAAAGARLHEF